MEEQWKIIPEFPLYRASNLGRVMGPKKPVRGSDNKGYLRTKIHVGGGIYKSIDIHRLVAMAFLERRPDQNEVNHKNGDKKDNRSENLEWCSHKENLGHATRVLGHYAKRLTADGARHIRELRLKGHTGTEIGKMLGLTANHVNDVLSRRSWNHVP